MNAFDENRRSRLAQLMKLVGQKNLAEKSGIAAAQIYQMAKGVGKNRRTVNDENARKLEEAADVANGWLDWEYQTSEPRLASGRAAADWARANFDQIADGDVEDPNRRRITIYSDEYDGDLTRDELADLVRTYSESKRAGMLAIPQLDVRASMGTGVDLHEHVDVVRTVRVSLPELRRQVPHFSAPENLRILTGLGDSMKPTFQDGDPLLIDIGVSEITVDGVYVLEKDDQLYVKRMQRRLIDGSLMMISDNKDYGSELIANGDRQKFAVRGRVLLAWNARRM